MILENSIFSNVKSRPSVYLLSTTDSLKHCSSQNVTFQNVTSFADLKFE